MVTQYDEKGKIFTQVIAKRPVHVTLQTTTHTIRGSIHIRPETRIKDALNTNGQERFLAVTDVVIYNSQKEEVYRSDFLVVNYEHIIWIIPEEED